MTEEEKINEEKSREKYFYIDKERTYQVLTGITTSFIGAGLALIVFAALHKPPVPPCGMQRPVPPCPMRMLNPGEGRPDMMLPLPPGDVFRGGREFRGHGPFKGHRDFWGKDLKKGKFLPPHGKKFDREAPVPPKEITETPKK